MQKVIQSSKFKLEFNGKKPQFKVTNDQISLVWRYIYINNNKKYVFDLKTANIVYKIYK